MKTMLVRGIRVGLVAGLMLTIGLIFYFAVIDNSPLPYHPMIDGWNDVILHIGAFGLLTVVSLLIWPPTWNLAVFLFCVGCAMELFQVLVPSREVDIMDIAANSVGILLGGAAFLLIRGLANRIGDRFRGVRE